MVEERDKRSKLRRRRFNLAILVVAGVILALVVFVVVRPSGPGASPLANRMVGVWTTKNPNGPGTTRILTFKPNGRFLSEIFQDDSGARVQANVGLWSVEGQTMVVRGDRSSDGRVVDWFLDHVPGIQRREYNVPIVRVTENELVAGRGAEPIVYTRVAPDQQNDAR